MSKRRFTERQFDIMSILWRDESATVREAKEKLDDDLAYTSVLTVFQTLEKNDHVSHVSEGKAYRYFPETSRSDTARMYADFLIEQDVELAHDIALKLKEDQRVQNVGMKRAVEGWN